MRHLPVSAIGLGFIVIATSMTARAQIANNFGCSGTYDECVGVGAYGGATSAIVASTNQANGQAVYGYNEGSSGSGSGIAIFGLSDSNGGTGIEGKCSRGPAGVLGYNSGTLYTGVTGQSHALSGWNGGLIPTTGVWGDSYAGYGIIGTSNGNTGVYGSSETNPGTHGDSYSGTGVEGISTYSWGVSGKSTWSYGGHFLSSDVDGLYAESDALSGGYSGVYGQTSDASGAGVAGVNNSSAGYGVWGHSPNDGYGVYGTSAGSHGVYGDITSQTEGTNAAVYGRSDEGGYGVYGYTNSGSAGVYGTTAYTNAVEGAATNTNGVGGYFTATNGYAGYFSSSTGKSLYATGGGDTAVYGTYTGAGYPNGVQGQATSATGHGNGVYGYAHASGFGVLGNNDNGGVGVKGECSGAGCYAGYFTADVYINGTTYPPSDIRFKKNVVPIKGAVDQLLRLHGVNFEWKEPAKHNDLTGTQIGFIAQDVEEVFPEWVRTDKEGFKALSVAQIEGLEVESIRILNDRANRADARATKAEARADKAEKDLADLRADVDALKANHPRTVATNTGVGGAGLGIFGLSVLGAAIILSKKKREEQAS